MDMDMDVVVCEEGCTDVVVCEEGTRMWCVCEEGTRMWCVCEEGYTDIVVGCAGVVWRSVCVCAVACHGWAAVSAVSVGAAVAAVAIGEAMPIGA
eukprot:1576212-Prymnesium_polylepis.2